MIRHQETRYLLRQLSPMRLS